eukprot:319491_1
MAGESVSERQELIKIKELSEDRDEHDVNADNDQELNISVKSGCLYSMDRYDKHYSSIIYQAECGSLCELILLIPTFSFSMIGIPILIIIYGVIFKSILYGLNVLICLICNEIIKRIIKRQRPCLIKETNLWPWMSAIVNTLTVSHTPSMPSGDTAQSVVFAISIIYTMNYHFVSTYSYLWWIIVLIIPFTVFGRVYFGQHYIGDTLVGLIEGIIIGTGLSFGAGEFLFF